MTQVALFSMLKKYWLKFFLGSILVGLSLWLVYFFNLQPSNDRDWEPEFSVMPEVQVNGEQITIKKTRDWRYTEQGPYSREYQDRTFNLTDLERVWFLMEPFSGWDGVAHTYFVFDFKNQEPISFSVEARREKGETFGAWTGLWRNFDVIYLWGSEKDFTVNRVITYRNDVYMFPLTISSESEQKLFLELATQTEELRHHPRFYNTITSNCTSILADHANRVKPGAVPFHYARILPGYAAKLVYDLGYLDQSQSYESLKEKYYINPLVKEIYQQEDFSQRLREKLLAN